MKQVKYIAFIFLLILVSSCKEDIPLQEFDSGIKISMWESAEADKRTLQFRCETEMIYPCMNYLIIHSVKRSSNTINIDFKGIYMPGICSNAFGPAVTTVNLETLPPGDYTLKLKVGAESSNAVLSVFPEMYSISSSSLEQIQFTPPQLSRIPENTIWGIIGYHISSNESSAQSFVDTLLQNGAVARKYTPGSYGYFNIHSDGTILPPENHGYWFVLPFILEFTGDNALIKMILEDFRKEYGDDLKITVHTTKGESFYSWR